MRVIDADEVVRFYNEQFPDLDCGVHWSRNDIIMNLNNIPTIEAIPVEWIKKYKRLDITDAIKMPCTASAFDIIRGWNTCLDKLLEDWEKENETN